jgi:predicted nucleotidyltransferase
LAPNLEQEAVKIADELGRVVFIGAIAVNHYSNYRTTKDIDLAIAAPLDEQKLVRLGYTRWSESKGTSWLSPRGIKVDFYTRDVGRIPVTWILDHAVQVRLGKNKEIRVMCLEGLMLAKHRAGRTTDIADLKQLLTHRGGSIDWTLMAEIAEPLEIAELQRISKALAC